MEFDVQSVDLDQLAEVAQKGGIEALEELAAAGKMVTPKEETTDAEPVTDAEPKEAAATEPAAAEPKPAAEETPAAENPDKDHTGAVSTRDGKGTIPYSVLKNARARASSLENTNLVLQKQLGELTQRLENGTPAGESAAKATGEVDQRIADMQGKVDLLKDEYPELAEMYSSQLDLLRETRKELVELQGRHEAEQKKREDEVQAAEAETVQEAIDGNPVLSFWADKAGAEWDAAVEMDALLREKPEWADKPYSERFAKVAEVIRVLHPEFEVPEPAATNTPADASTEQKPQAPASDKRPPVVSLSDIPGGVAPAGNKREQVEEMSGVALGNRFMSMTPDQIQEYLASLGM